jgi:hypothetical protein
MKTKNQRTVEEILREYEVLSRGEWEAIDRRSALCKELDHCISDVSRVWKRSVKAALPKGWVIHEARAYHHIDHRDYSAGIYVTADVLPAASNMDGALRLSVRNERAQEILDILSSLKPVSSRSLEAAE